MSIPYKVSQNSVITSIFSGVTPSSIRFLTCGGTNIAPKSGVWNNFTVGTTNFKYIFNVGKFNGTTSPSVTGYPEGGTAPTTIKQSLHDKGTIQYICGQFTAFSSNSAQNVAWFNPVVSNTSDVTFNNLSNITFTGTSNAVNCMTSDLSGTFSKIFLAGRFDTATIGAPTTWKNMVRLNVTTTQVYTIDTSFKTTGTLLDSSTVTINSMIIVNKILYVAGTDGTNCVFFRYNGTTWTNLLLSPITPITGKINVLQAISTTKIAIGGNFTSIGSATNCNNVAIFTISNTISNASYTVLGAGGTKGVTGVAGSSPIYAAPEVFALSYVTNLLWVGGYFVNAGGNPSNSIAIYNVPTNSWSTVRKDNPGTIGLLKDTSDTDPGVVYALYISPNDTGIIMVGGSFKTITSIVSPSSKISENIFNLVKITTATITSTATTRTYSKFNSLSTTPAPKA
jgi:hypothetical protein